MCVCVSLCWHISQQIRSALKENTWRKNKTKKQQKNGEEGVRKQSKTMKPTKQPVSGDCANEVKSTETEGEGEGEGAEG